MSPPCHPHPLWLPVRAAVTVASSGAPLLFPRLRHRDAHHLRPDSHLLQHHPVLYTLLPVRLLRARAALGFL